ncbi:MAG TPA: hypothetical protein VEC16_02570 [Alphaproteobacteria bacterium]|nr:hypothetical protein [Alphaproteobacteria bacterium]
MEQFKQRTINFDGTEIIEYGFSDENEPFQKFDKTSLYPQLDTLEKIYEKEKLLVIDGKRHPSVLLAAIDLENLENYTQDNKFQIPPFLEKFYEGMKAEKVKPKHTNGRRIRIVDHRPSFGTKNYILNIQETSYFDFMMTNASQDAILKNYDSKFFEGSTLRSLNALDGKAYPLHASSMSNMLGLAFLIKINDSKDNPYLFFGKRKGDRTVGANTVSLLGGTPEWDDGFKDKSVKLRDVVYKNTKEELNEELGIPANEFDITKLYFCQDFTRAPTLIVKSEIGKSKINSNGKIVLEDMIDILSSTPSVKDEHSEFYAVPATKQGFDAIINNYNFNVISRTGFFLYLSHGKNYIPKAPTFFPFKKK